MTARVITFGCRLNAYESQVMRAKAAEAGADDAIIVNTCAVTTEAARQARQAIRRARRDHPAARIVVTGCAAQIEPERFAAMPEVDVVLGNAEKLEAESYAPDFGARLKVDDIMSVREAAGYMIDGMADRCRAFIEVQNGCDHRCTFCIIPFGRGPSRSVPAGAVVEQTRRLVGNGIAEVVLTGVDITAYGADLPGRPTLGALVRRILDAVPDLKRLRLTSIDTIEADTELFEAIGEDERLMPHFHLSLQSGDDMILKRMKRRHTRDQAVEFCENVRRRPDAVFGADLIAGFPTETDAAAENSLKLVEDCDLTFLHVFPFSPRPGTPAQRMPQLPGSVVRARAQQLRDAGDRALGRFLDAEVGETRTVLVENGGEGRTPQYATVRLTGEATPGTLRQARIVGRDHDRLEGTLVA
ncbi:MAG TPA: tRNA (N(6)-L-threonylcarbamoyladenosine(37)-C(2))-methylthiotransferase MtaB [Aestuariivirgaceae bacterium]|nr:tRNA (N(6)-L-threonylcarbamoyladenosine(37)-C(2))-methylthiotransferase MtaB [Aestuariivirgaceae bacterium]